MCDWTADDAQCESVRGSYYAYEERKSMKTETVKHTPGPWEIGELDPYGQAIVRNKDIEIATCWHHCVGAIEQEMRANARLIAAAPELLATCEAIQKAMRDEFRYLDNIDRALLDKVEAAIAKARGE